MCFKNLPIEFDESGKAILKGGVRDPYSTKNVITSVGEVEQMPYETVRELLSRNGYIKDVDFDPVTRVAGALAFHGVADLKEKKFIEARSMATLFRGYELIMQGRAPSDAIFITSRACGVCGGVHSSCAALGIEMAYGIKPPPLGIIVRNLLLSIEFLYDHPLHLFLLAGPDYSELLVKASTPKLWERATKTEAKFAAVHGYKTIGDLMTDMNPLSGSLYLEALQMTRVAREAYVIIGGKYPHPETLVPGGVSTTITLQVFNEIYTRLHQFFDYSKKVVAIWDDITEFFYEADPAYMKNGMRAANMVDFGIWDDVDTYDATYENCGSWGEKRWATPGAVIGGELVTTNLQNINLGLEEFVDHAFYDEWTNGNGNPKFPTDPSGSPLSPYHPWNKITAPKPTGQNWREKYTWSTAPRWDRQVFEAGAYVRVWNTAAAKKLRPNPFLESTGYSLKMNLPKGARPEMNLEWKIPQVWNTFERNRARAYAISYTALVAMNDWLKGLELLKKGESEVATKFDIPKNNRLGVGFWGAGRGFLSHHMELDKGVVTNYQIVTPSTINASPQDAWDKPGPYEEAILNTPILEEFDKQEDYKGIDLLRALRSFDPCMPCTTHIYAGEHKVVREINTCACGVDH
jgi:hydrogenase large subunit